MPRGYARSDRVASRIREEIINIISREVKDPRLGFVTVTGVRLTGDLQHAKVYVSILGGDDERKAALRALEHASGFIRHELGPRLRLRHLPDVAFIEDASAREGVRIDGLIEDWKRRTPSAEAESLDETLALPRIVEVIGRGQRFLLTTHLAPDGDSLGSALALAHTLDRLGKVAHVVSRDPLPDRYRFLPGVERVEIRERLPDGGEGRSDAAFTFECPDLSRTGWEDLHERYYLVNIDHHEDNSLFGHLNWVEPSAPAVGEMVYRLIQGLGVEVTPDVATCIYTSIMTDTGSFTYSNTSAKSLRLGAEMVELGADPHHIALNVYDSNRFEKVRLLGIALRNLSRDATGRIAWLKVGKQELALSGALPEEMDDLVNYPRSIRGVDVAIIFKEVAEGRYRVSLRSKGLVDVFHVAKRFGGGGHRNAAGCSVEGGFDLVHAAIMAEVEQACRSADARGAEDPGPE